MALVRIFIFGTFFIAGLTIPASAGVKEAVAYLEDEVPRWKTENKCYSCHNNGDGARALILAKSGKQESIRDTLRFLSNPAEWPADLAPLALVQYTAALAASGDTSSAAFKAGVHRIVAAQKPDGHWEMDAESTTGSPVTYGPVLGTVIARDLVAKTGANVSKATAWLEQRKADHPLDIAALILGLGRKTDIDRLAALQSKDGSWNGGEVFDTAIAVIALANHVPAAAARGREWLVKNQLEPGGWRGTTRPSGGQSYAQHISTTAWALQALLTGPR
jgi:hypothetical protein